MYNMASILQAIGYHAAIIYPLLPTYTLLLISALIPIYTGAHASLTCPTSAAKPSKFHGTPSSSSDEDDEAHDPAKMEGLGPADALALPFFAGLSLTALYVLIKWFEDPALLNRILNAYFSFFGVLAMAKLGADAMSVVHDFVFPDCYIIGNSKTVWRVNSKHRAVYANPPSESRPPKYSPLPGVLSLVPIPFSVKSALWTLRELPRRESRLRVHVHGLLSGSIKIRPFAVLSTLIAALIALYTNFVSMPWYLNNLSAFAFVYGALQVMTPTTSWTATLILGGLFVYDIYFVFYTPLMVEVATKLDIPAKMLFPRPEGMSMLGLGDLAVPGIVIGFALRFDLWSHYFKQQRQQKKVESEGNGRVTRSAAKTAAITKAGVADGKDSTTIKPTYRKATGHWGTRFWTGPRHDALLTGTYFPKPYFNATMIGYVLGMLCTLLVMQVYGHAQPALLYLVPGVLAGIWGTALSKGEIGVLWSYHEDVEGGSTDKEAGAAQEAVQGRSGNDQVGWSGTLRNFFSQSDDVDKPKKVAASENDKTNGAPSQSQGSTPNSKKQVTFKNEASPEPWHGNQLFYFSIGSPTTRSSTKRTPLSIHTEDEIHLAREDSAQVGHSNSNSSSSDDEEGSRLLDKLEKIGYTPPTPPIGYKGAKGKSKPASQGVRRRGGGEFEDWKVE